jgi:hypothetical protein
MSNQISMKYNRVYFFFNLLFVFGLLSCQMAKQNYLKHDMKAEKIADNCGGTDPAVKIEVNTIGERYEFEKCLEASGEYHYDAENKNDTLKIHWRPASGKTALYKVTLDINTEPAYHYVNMDGSIMAVNITR